MATGIAMASGICASSTCIPYLAISSRMMFWKISPKPSGISMYGAFRPKVSAVATARRSMSIRLKTASKGGMRIGMKAMWTGTMFCDRQASPAIPKSVIARLPLISGRIRRISFPVIPERATMTERMPSRM